MNNASKRYTLFSKAPRMASLHDLEHLKTELELMEAKIASMLKLIHASLNKLRLVESGSRIGTDPIPLTPAYDTRSIMSSVSVSKHIHDTASAVSRTRSSPQGAAPSPAFHTEDFNDMFGNLSHISART